MPVAVVTDYKAATLEQYDNLLTKLGYTSGGQGPPGSLFHWGTNTADGVRTVDIWTDRASYDGYLNERLAAAAAAIGLDQEPRVAFIEVRNYLTQG
jgi:hypothetical protein